MKKYLAIALLPLALASCAVSPQDLTAKSDAVVANAQTEIGMACWVVKAAQAIYEAVGVRDESTNKHVAQAVD